MEGCGGSCEGGGGEGVCGAKGDGGGEWALCACEGERGEKVLGGCERDVGGQMKYAE